MPRNAGIILNITSVTSLEVPPVPGETVYHSNKGTQDVAERSGLYAGSAYEYLDQGVGCGSIR